MRPTKSQGVTPKVGVSAGNADSAKTKPTSAVGSVVMPCAVVQALGDLAGWSI